MLMLLKCPTLNLPKVYSMVPKTEMVGYGDVANLILMRFIRKWYMH